MRFFLILLIPTVFQIASLSAQRVTAERLTIDHGLSQGMIFDLCQTRDGFLWAATKDGLNRYDGYNFKIYSHNPFDPYSVAENTVASLFEDSRGWLWIGTETKGLDLYNPKTGHFHHFPLNVGNTRLVERVATLKIRETADGTIWVRKGGLGLIRIQIPKAWETALPAVPDLSKLTSVTPLSHSMLQDPNDFPIDFELTSNGQLFVSAANEQYIINPQNGTHKRVHEGLLDKGVEMMALISQGDKSVFWTLYKNKICILQNGVVKTFMTPMAMASAQRKLLSDDAGHVWLNLGPHVWELDPNKDLDFSKPSFDIPEYASCLMHDRNGNLWVGTQGYGLYKMYAPKKHFHAGAVGTSIAGLWRSRSGQYYCKSYISIISKYDPLTGKLATNSAFPEIGTNQEALAFDSKENIWLLSSQHVMLDEAILSRHHPDGRLAASYRIETKLSHRENLFFNQNGQLWITLAACQMIRFDPETGSQEPFRFDTLFDGKTATVMTTAFVESANGVLWIGTQLGLVKGVPKEHTYEFQLIQADPKNSKGLNNNSIACLLPDPLNPDGVLWIGTKGGGIQRFDLQTNHFQHITTKEGLPNNVVYGILADGKNKLWCSTNRGLAKLIQRPETSSPLVFDITAYTVKMGLQDNEFNSFAYFKADNGEMLFGGVNGLNRFFPDELQQDTTRPPVFVVGLEINYLPATPEFLSVPVESLRKLELRHDQNNISFEFAALDFTDPGKNRYRYRLVGLEKDWVGTGTKRFAHFTHLRPGRYEFQVEGSDGESGWQSAAHSIVVVIHPPWWQSSLAYLAYALILLLLGWKIYQGQIRRVKMREQIAFSFRESERVRLLEQMKANFFSNVTHEFRTPLTLIMEPLRQLLKTPVSEGWRSKVQLAESNSRKLLGLVNQLLDMAKLEGGNLSLDVRLGNPKQIVRDVVETFLPLAEQRGIQLRSNTPPGAPSFIFDAGKLESILNNLISNALKFTPQGGTVTVDLKMSESMPSIVPNNQRSMTITVSDDGIGIPEEDLPRVFDRFFQADTANARLGEGSGIGLSLSKELAELMGGGISVESVLGKGTVFSCWLPEPEISQEECPKKPETLADLTTPVFVSPSLRKKPLVLLIEDNAEMRSFIRESLGESWEVAQASGGEEGLQKAIEMLPDLIVSDVMMPDADGYEVCSTLKNNPLTAHIPIILLTASAGMDARLKGLHSGADDYLSKPFNTEELLARMQNLLTTHRKLLPRIEDDFLSPELSASDAEFLRTLRRTLEQQISNEFLGIEELAQMLNISRMQLHRKLKALSQQSATEYLRIYRLERAMSLLKNKEGNVKQVSKMVGFGNEKYFSKAFKAHFGISPSEVGP